MRMRLVRAVFAVITAACLWTLVAGSATAEAPSHCQDILSELRSLRIELLQEKLERAHVRIAEVQQQLESIEAERSRLTQIEQAQSQELAELHERLNQPGLTAEDRAQIDEQRSHFTTAATVRLAERATSIAQRDAALRERLKREQQEGQRLAS